MRIHSTFIGELTITKGAFIIRHLSFLFQLLYITLPNSFGSSSIGINSVFGRRFAWRLGFLDDTRRDRCSSRGWKIQSPFCRIPWIKWPGNVPGPRAATRPGGLPLATSCRPPTVVVNTVPPTKFIFGVIKTVFPSVTCEANHVSHKTRQQHQLRNIMDAL